MSSALKKTLDEYTALKDSEKKEFLLEWLLLQSEDNKDNTDLDSVFN